MSFESILSAPISYSLLEILEMESAVVILLNYEDNAKWLSKNYDKLKAKFNDEWVAVLNRKVIDHDPRLTTLVKRLRQQHPKVYNKIATEYVTDKELTLIL
jgi:hypothetical protein